MSTGTGVKTLELLSSPAGFKCQNFAQNYTSKTTVHPPYFVIRHPNFPPIVLIRRLAQADMF